MCVGDSVWLGWGGIRVAGFSLQYGYHSNPTTPKHQHTSNKENATKVVIQQNSHKLLMMDILMSETCWAHKKWNKIASDIKLVSYSSTITMMHGPINIRSHNQFRRFTRYSHAPPNDVSVNDGPHIRRLCHKIIIRTYHSVTTAYSMQYSNMLYRFLA